MDDKRRYIEHYGMHFNEKLCDFALSQMKDADGRLKAWTEDEVEDLLEKFSIKVDDDDEWDSVYVANMCKADYFGSSITTEEQVAKYVGDYINDTDGYEGKTFARWCSDMCCMDIDIDWEKML